MRPSQETAGGSRETRDFYEREGWREREGRTLDQQLFGSRGEGPIRRRLHALHRERISDLLRSVAPLDRLLECGCGGNPELSLLEHCESYAGVDFTARGLALARRRLEAAGARFTLERADICALPFRAGSFDAVYSAHALYHIPDPRHQRRAFDEIARVLRPGGVAILLLANPRPLLFPLRLARRLLADTPGLGTLADRLRKPPPLPYRPMPLGWMRRVLEAHGSVEIVTGGLASTWLKQRVGERAAPGRWLWRGLEGLDRYGPRISARLGNYVQVALRKHPRLDG
ncbi:MAG: class I SAM-dependent methyltransferase [Myxococcota bacterium]